MRDEKARYSTATLTRTRLSNGYTDGGRNSQNLREFSYRSDIKKTLPFQGQYYRPTSYEACFMEITPNQCDYVYHPNGSPNDLWRRSGISHWSSASGATWEGLVATLGRAYPAVTLNMRWECQSKVLAKLKGDEFQAGVFAAELKKTALMLDSTLLRVLDAYRQVRRRNYANAARILGLRYNAKGKFLTPQKAWLGMQYGWLPLLRDAHDAFETLRKGNKAPYSTVQTVVRRELGMPFNYGINPETSGSVVVGVEIQITYGLDNRFLAYMDSIGLVNPAAILWELVPYSFVVDWIVPIGQFLENISAGVGLRFLSGYRTEWTKSAFTHRYVASTENFVRGTKQSYQVKALSMLRVPLASFPASSLYLKTSGFTAVKTATAIALLTKGR